MLIKMWRFFVALFDWREWLRKAQAKSLIDAVFVTNMRDEIDRRRCRGKWTPPEGHLNFARLLIKGIAGRTRVIDSLTEDLLSSHGRKKAKEQFISAVKWAEKNGAKVVLLAASTKRLFGEDGRTLKERFPRLVFTIGDNGTALLLIKETLRALDKAGLKPGRSRVGILAPYGILGRAVTEALCKKGYNLVGAGPNVQALAKLAAEYKIETVSSFEDMGRVDAVIACTHSEKIRLTAENIELIRHEDRKLLVVDVAEPSNLSNEEYRKCRAVVIRQDAGNAYSPALKYVLGAITYRIFRLTRGVTFGCFAETLALAAALNRGERFDNTDWFTVSGPNMELVERLFEQEGFTVPTPRCFGRKLTSFDLEIKNIARKEQVKMKVENETTESTEILGVLKTNFLSTLNEGTEGRE